MGGGAVSSCTSTGSQKPPMHAALGSQQSAAVSQRSSSLAQRSGSQPHLPSLALGSLRQKPQQQSTPLVQALRSARHGSSAANARMLPDSSSWLGR